MCPRPAPLALALIAMPAILSPGRVAAEPLDDPKIAYADRLFVEARALLESNLLQACAKFDESLRYNPAAIGTLLNVAVCDEKLGRIASAVARFSEARDRAKELNLPDYVRVAEKHITALEPNVPHLSIRLTEALPDTTIVLDDRVVAPIALGDVTVDPGERELVVSAPGRLPYRTTLVVARAERREVVVPALATSVTVTSSRRFVGQVTTVAGAAIVGTAVGIGLYGRKLRLDQFDRGRCASTAGGDRCDRDGQTQINRARTLGNVGTAVGIVGLAATGVGLYLWLRAPRDAADRGAPGASGAPGVSLVPQLAPDAVGVAAVGRF